MAADPRRSPRPQPARVRQRPEGTPARRPRAAQRAPESSLRPRAQSASKRASTLESPRGVPGGTHPLPPTQPRPRSRMVSWLASRVAACTFLATGLALSACSRAPGAEGTPLAGAREPEAVRVVAAPVELREMGRRLETTTR